MAQQMPPQPAADAAKNEGRWSWLWWLGGAVLLVLILGAIAQSRTASRAKTRV
ncbi:hypothetical protein [Asanoa sp. NPDC050611]|uniref:hypothetical protein n=1 Tax=Asanoa sp. NPDC050611 TaxID=3157098 RepID=UPI0033ED48D9